MTQKSYIALDNEHSVLALLKKGYSFIEVGSHITYQKREAGGQAEEHTAFTEVIPHTEPLGDKEYLLLSQFLKDAPNPVFRVDSRYF